MAISLKTAGTWARVVADPSSVTIPGSPAAGDRMYLFASWKTFSITVADPSGWTLLDDFSDGAVAAGNGTGSVHNAVWYRDWQSGDGNPSLNWSAAPTEAHAVIMLWQKAGGDVWGTPAAVHAAIAAADPFSATSSAEVTVGDGSVVMCLVGLRDDSTTIARTATTAIEDDGSPDVTWNGNYVESPAAHFNSTTGNDMSGDLGHRFVTTGAAGVNLTTTGDPVAAETGTATWVVQGLATTVTLTPDPVAVTPAVPAPTLALDLSFAPAAVPVTAAVPVPTLALDLGLAPAAVPASVTVPVSSLVVDQIFAPDPVPASASVPASSLALEGALTPAPIWATVTVPTPTLGLALELTPAPIPVTLGIPSPVLATALNLAPAPVQAVLNVTSSALALLLNLAPAPVLALLVVPEPELDVGGGDTTLEPDPVLTTAQVTDSTLDLALSLLPAPVAAILGVPAPVLGLALELTPAPIVAALTVPDPSVAVDQIFAPAPIPVLLLVPASSIGAPEGVILIASSISIYPTVGTGIAPAAAATSSVKDAGNP